MSEYTLTTEDVRNAWRFAYPGKAVQFDHWLSRHDREVAENAWRAGANTGIFFTTRGQAVIFDKDNPYTEENNE